MADRNLDELLEFVTATPEIPWADFVCTPVVDFDAKGKALTTVRRCAVTAGDRTVVVHLPHKVAIGRGQPWPPQAILDRILEAVGPIVSV